MSGNSTLLQEQLNAKEKEVKDMKSLRKRCNQLELENGELKKQNWASSSKAYVSEDH